MGKLILKPILKHYLRIQSHFGCKPSKVERAFFEAGKTLAELRVRP